MLRSLLALVTGVIVVYALAVMANAVVFHGASQEATPAVPLQVLLLGMGALAAIVGGYAAGAIAGRRPLAHGLALGLLLAAIRVAMLARDRPGMGSASESRWFTIAVMVGAFIGGTLGGVMRAQRAHAVSAPE